MGATVSHLPLPTLPAGRTKIRPYTRLHGLTHAYTGLHGLTGCPHPPCATNPSFSATSTRIRHLGAPNLERHANWATDGALFCSTSTGIRHFGAPKSFKLFDVNEESPPRRFKICSCALWRLIRGPLFRRRQRRFEHAHKVAPRRPKIQTSRWPKSPQDGPKWPQDDPRWL